MELGKVEIRKRYLTIDATAKALEINRFTIYKWIKRGLLPNPLKIGRRSYYPKELIEKIFSYVEENGKLEPYWWERI